jgi:hypothetical protein
MRCPRSSGCAKSWIRMCLSPTSAFTSPHGGDKCNGSKKCPDHSPFGQICSIRRNTAWTERAQCIRAKSGIGRETTLEKLPLGSRERRRAFLPRSPRATNSARRTGCFEAGLAVAFLLSSCQLIDTVKGFRKVFQRDRKD